MEITLNRKIAKKVLEIVDKGLVNGLGVREPGKMCIEAAVCYALGLPHGDNPPFTLPLLLTLPLPLKKNKKFYLKVLNLIAGCGLDALIEMKSPGCKWLSLCK